MKEPEIDLLCPTCARDLREHSQQELRACALESGGEVSGDHIDMIDVQFKGQDTDPKKRAERRAEAMRSACPTCTKPFGEHTRAEIRACADKQRDIKLKDVRCPICSKLVLEHSHSEGVACSDKARAKEH